MCVYGRRLGRSCRSCSWIGTGAGAGGELNKHGEADGATEGKYGAVEAAAVQANCIWLISGATVTLNFLKKSMSRMRLATAAWKKLDVKSLPWHCTVFLMKPQERIGCPSAPLSRGPDGLEFLLQGTMLKVAPVSTKYLSFVSSSVRKMSPALAGKCIAVTMACAGLAAELKMVRRQTSFMTKHRVKNTCEPYWRSNCEICTRHCQGSEINGNLGGRGGNFLLPRLSPLLPLLGAGLLLCWVVADATVVSCPPPASHRASAAFTMAVAVMWLPVGDVVLASPWRHWAWGLAFSWGGVIAQNRIAICSF